MKRLSWLPRMLSTFWVVCILMTVYTLWARPRQLRWGATDEEIQRAMPGDDLDPAPDFLATRAITIGATPDEIFPWLLQMAYGRAGFYGYDIIENVGSPYGIKSTEHITYQRDCGNGLLCH